jgi:hypothetical protein
MPPRAKGARLWLRTERRSPSGKLISRASWLILDAGRHIATGCAPSEIAAAEARLAEYIATKYRPRRKERGIEEIRIADVLTIYLEDRRDDIARRNELQDRLGRLNEFWGEKTLAEISGETCGAYVLSRGTASGARRDLEDLRAAIGHHAREGFHRGFVRVSLPGLLEHARDPTRYSNGQISATPHRSVHFDRALYRHASGSDCSFSTSTSRRPGLRRS